MLPRLIASFFGSGYARRAPGTVGSVAALPLGALMLLGPAWLLPAAVLAATAAGWWAIRRADVQGDPGWVVIDEVAGQWLALVPLARPSWLGVALAFALFRLFDIAKPGPVGWADRQEGAAGIMADDLIAGAFAALLVLLTRKVIPGVLD